MSVPGGWGLVRLLLPIAAALSACAGDASRMSSPADAPSAGSVAPAPLAVAAGGAARPSLPASATAASLVGLSAGELSALIGPPRWSRRESPAQVWQYQGASCVLDIYLYEEGDGPRVVYAEARDESRLPVTLSVCLERIEAERRRPAPTS